MLLFRSSLQQGTLSARVLPPRHAYRPRGLVESGRCLCLGSHVGRPRWVAGADQPVTAVAKDRRSTAIGPGPRHGPVYLQFAALHTTGSRSAAVVAHSPSGIPLAPEDSTIPLSLPEETLRETEESMPRTKRPATGNHENGVVVEEKDLSAPDLLRQVTQPNGEALDSRSNGEPDALRSEKEISMDPESDEDIPVDPEEFKEALSRPPPVNSDYLPLPWKGRLGYVRSTV